MDDHHSRMSGQSLSNCVLRYQKEKEPEDSIKIFLRCWKYEYKGGVMPLTFKPFINLAEAIALAKETGKPVLVKP